MADSRDITGKNRKFTGTGGIKIPTGTEAQRVDEQGQLRFNTEIELMEYYDGNAWKAVDAPPTISSITTSDSDGDNTILNADGSTLYTITINGGNFSLNPTVTFIGDTGTEYSAGNITRVSGSQITCTTLSSMGTSDDPYDVKVENTSGLSATLDDAFSFNAAPVFDTPSGQLGTVYDGQTISGSTFDASATDAEGNTITYSIVSGSLPGSGLSLSSSTGLITGTLSGTPSLGNYPFVVRASTAEGVIERQFSIQVIAFPFVAASGGTETTDGDFKVHTFTSPGTFTVTAAGAPSGSNSVEYLVLAGGGGGGDGRGGGGGAGGYRTNFPSPATGGLPVSATSYPITVGSGGGGALVNDNVGSPGNPSIFSSITSTGGGRSGAVNPSNTIKQGQPGGSGGGAGGTFSAPTAQPGGTGNSPPVSPPQGNNGGNGVNNGPPTVPGSSSHGATGGGAGGAGIPATGTPAPGTGGPGAASSITGSSVTRGGGGGGASDTGRTLGGPGGGGDGASNPVSGNPPLKNGGTNLGGGGGGVGVTLDGGNGGSGVVIIRYKFQ